MYTPVVTGMGLWGITSWVFEGRNRFFLDRFGGALRTSEFKKFGGSLRRCV